jgi:PmbA protein
MLSAESVQKGRSPFADRLGERIASPLVELIDDPTRSASLAAEEHDGEGLACRANPLLAAGVLQGFLYDATTARRGGTASTGSAVRSARGLPTPGPQLLVLEPGTTPAEQLRRGLPLALAVESFSGLHSGVNPVSGDFSVGAEGVMIRDGELAEPVRELTLASTLQRLLLGVVAVGDDFEWLPSGNGAATLCIEDVSVSGT